MFISIYNFFCEAPRSIIIINSIERAEILLLIRIFFFFHFILLWTEWKWKWMYVRLYTIIKSKARKRGSKKMQEASFNNLNKQRVKHTFFSRKNVHKKYSLQFGWDLYKKIKYGRLWVNCYCVNKCRVSSMWRR